MASKRQSRRRRKDDAKLEQGSSRPKTKGLQGGRYQPLSETDVQQIDEGIRFVLGNVGFSEGPAVVTEAVLARGGVLNDEGRLLFPEALFNEALEGLERNFSLFGQSGEHEISMSAKRVHVGSGGAAPQVVDLETGQYRDSNLQDLYDAARLVDALDKIQFFSRSLVARGMPDELSLDVNTAYACLAGTSKHVCTSVTLPQHVELIADICFSVAGSKEAFLAKPFLSLNVNHVVPPLRFHRESCEVMAEAARLGIPVHANAFGQLGASSPVTSAGSIVQNVAESLAGMIFAWLINPRAKIMLGSRPMITDLRTGSMSGGSGEQALIMAATTQMAQFYNLSNTCIAGATDSKLPDAQSGYEKSLAVTLAAQVGSNMITQACGMQAGLMAVAFESYVIDNDMLGSILRSISPLSITKETLATDVIKNIVQGEGHFLGHPDTYKRMKSDFLYPSIADRRSPQDWESDGAQTIQEVAKTRTRELLSTHYPRHISVELDKDLRARYDIRLDSSAKDYKGGL